MEVPETDDFVRDGIASGLPIMPDMNRDEALPNRNEATLRANTGVHTTLKTLRGRLQNLRNPDGTKTNPAKTCQDLRQCYPQMKSGEAHFSPLACLPEGAAHQRSSPSLSPPSRRVLDRSQ